jgi:hypothetical protein
VVRELSARTGVAGDEKGRVVWAELAWEQRECGNAGLTPRLALTGVCQTVQGDRFDLDTGAFAAPAVDVDGLRLATSDLVQHGLARHAEQLRGPDDRLPLARSGKAVRNSPRD